MTSIASRFSSSSQRISPALAPIEEGQAAPAEELLHVRRHRALAHDDVAVDEAPRRLGAGDDDGFPSEDVRAEDAAVLRQALVEKAERILRERDRLAEPREYGAPR